VAARVRFLGPRPDVPALLGRLDLFVLPSLWEGLPNAALEAMAARRAVVATNVDGTPEAVADGVTGLLVPPADADALARAIAILLRDPERRGTLAEAGRRRVEREFGMDRMVAETQQVYREAMAEVRA
jgi:starch synthase (maltosyl-transferring)